MKDVLEIVKHLDKSCLLVKGASKTTENEAKEQQGRFRSLLLRTLGANLLGNVLAVKGVIRSVWWRSVSNKSMTRHY